ncbi:hypothetical protein CC1G_07216 [Coprinopsis cinerea okayama7|uniref:Transmembrane protein n=1 Tax=Coprinopsis cinerea (strain Okayama-7 / 130 / ATCC MYA-4618 / FGSC 9003) TaxID=240176 RepID=A8PCY4_COPC7|nr:hypothetical protein CC1G_07216 [Coprinopsis cinerea okayama7\|eukprot:XP_001840486.2 hypothetical protein CC1G_07216 [Coprinopsis cinerea okayama7\
MPFGNASTRRDSSMRIAGKSRVGLFNFELASRLGASFRERMGETDSRDNPTTTNHALIASVSLGIGLAIPFLIVRRRRQVVARSGVDMTYPGPPRRAPANQALLTRRANVSGSPIRDVKVQKGTPEEMTEQEDSVKAFGFRESLSHLNAQNGALGAKALGIATVGVAAGGFGIWWGFTNLLTVEERDRLLVRFKSSTNSPGNT